MENKLIRKQIRRSFNPVGWSLVIYYVLMNMAVMGMMALEMIFQGIKAAATGEMMSQEAMTEAMMNNGWGYILASTVAIGILLAWKGIGFWKNEIWAKGRPMTAGAFFGLLAVFLGVQLPASIGASVLEAFLNLFGLSAQASMESASANAESFSMFLYMGIFAPVTEELIFRGLVQRTLTPYGKKFAIFGSAFLFGIFHGNLVQTPYAFLVGLVLGYVASEYSIAWAMLLHLINNMILGDSLTRLTSGLPEDLANLIFTLIVTGCALAGIIVLICKRKKVAADLAGPKISGQCMGCFFSNLGVIVLSVLMVGNMVLMLFM